MQLENNIKKKFHVKWPVIVFIIWEIFVILTTLNSPEINDKFGSIMTVTMVSFLIALTLSLIAQYIKKILGKDKNSPEIISVTPNKKDVFKATNLLKLTIVSILMLFIIIMLLLVILWIIANFTGGY